jgi:hypothetical protein
LGTYLFAPSTVLGGRVTMLRSLVDCNSVNIRFVFSKYQICVCIWIIFSPNLTIFHSLYLRLRLKYNSRSISFLSFLVYTPLNPMLPLLNSPNYYPFPLPPSTGNSPRTLPPTPLPTLPTKDLFLILLISYLSCISLGYSSFHG